MKAQRNYYKKLSTIALASFVAIVTSACSPAPQSVAEQQVDTIKSTNKDNAEPLIIKAESAKSSDKNDDYIPAPNVTAKPQQAIARQPNCDPETTVCQYFELTTLSFEPEQRWLTHILWQSIARILDPKTPLVSEDESAKKMVTKLFNQIAYGEAPQATQPMYQRVDTAFVKISSGSPDKAALSYLKISLNKHREDNPPQALSYIMLEMQKQLQLNLTDILLPTADLDDVMRAAEPAKIKWLSDQGIEAKFLEDWSIEPPEQWYLNNDGLHLVYQPKEILETIEAPADLIVPFNELQGMIKPRYVVASPDANLENSPSKSNPSKSSGAHEKNAAEKMTTETNETAIKKLD